ncbi:MAG: ABC-F family ATP-binding cassette domain-containing protein [Acidobacteria bacterium]|nr:ABC-F family ATP-binding cassette domain-containing protein [Acidobacteriota bacterium]
MLFRFEDVSKSYGAHDVLRGMTLQVNPSERVGLVGRNGAGKTTIFRLLTKVEEPDGGSVSLLRGLRLGILEQRPTFANQRTVRDEALTVFAAFQAMEAEMSRLEHLMAEAQDEALDAVMHNYSDLRHRYELEGGFAYAARAEAVLVGLGFQGNDFEQQAELLSGGQKSRLALAKLLLSEPDVLLLDEPTNHLDVNAVEWLEDFFSEYQKAFVIISHDRFLLDRLATKIIEVEAGRANVYQGNYSAYVRQREERRLAQMREYEKQQELIERTEDFIRRNLAGQKTKQAKSRRNMLERLERVEAVQENHTGSFKLQSVIRTGDNVLAVSDLAVGYGKKRLAADLNFLLHRGERLGVIGPNGSGKTTFLKTITNEIEPLAGGLTWGANVHLDYFDQELNSLSDRAIVIEEMAAAAPRAMEGELRGYLARFLFTGDEIYKPVAALSGGERCRLALAKLIYSKANVLILDEPTNHLDISSREALEIALSEYQGTIITVSHDRYFLDRIATEILHFENGAATYHTGSYSEYYELRHRHQTSKAVEQRDKQREVNRQSKAPKPKTNKQRGRSLEQVEQEIAALETELADLANQLANPSATWSADDYAIINLRQQEISSRLEALVQEWEVVASASAT